MKDPKKRILRQLAVTEKSFGAAGLSGWMLMPQKPVNPPCLSAASGSDSGAATAGWDDLKAAASGCERCGLCRTRTRVVFGEGDVRASLMFIGEAPGHDEDIEGRPFVGRAGQLLDKIIIAMGLGRNKVYIANCLKCRPPGNRNPLPDEVSMCRPFLKRQIDLIKPRVICALGKFAAQSLLETETPISQLRGKFFEQDGIALMPTYHPAYLLRNPSEKKAVWQDMKEILRKLSLPIPDASR